MSSTHQTRPVDPVTDPDARATAPRTQPPGKGRPLSAAARVAGLVGLVTVVACLLVTALGWPAVTSAPHDLPIGVAAPPQAAGAIASRLSAARPGAFAVTTYADEEALRAAILQRRVYGGPVLGADGPHMLVTSAASPVVAQALRGLAGQLGASAGAGAMPVVDVVPLPAADPNGIGLASVAVPMAIGGIATAVGATLLLGGGTPRRRLFVRATGVVATSLVAAFAVMAIVGFGFGSVAGAYIGSSLVLALGVAAIGFALTGLQMLAGRVGLVLGILGVVVFGLSLSAIGSAPELLPAGWGTVGQLFPHGATATALRSVAYFDGNGAARSLVALGGWVVGGAVLTVLAGRARGRS